MLLLDAGHVEGIGGSKSEVSGRVGEGTGGTSHPIGFVLVHLATLIPLKKCLGSAYVVIVWV